MQKTFIVTSELVSSISLASLVMLVLTALSGYFFGRSKSKKWIHEICRYFLYPFLLCDVLAILVLVHGRYDPSDIHFWIHETKAVVFTIVFIYLVRFTKPKINLEKHLLSAVLAIAIFATLVFSGKNLLDKNHFSPRAATFSLALH